MKKEDEQRQQQERRPRGQREGRADNSRGCRLGPQLQTPEGVETGQEEALPEAPKEAVGKGPKRGGTVSSLDLCSLWKPPGPPLCLHAGKHKTAFPHGETLRLLGKAKLGLEAGDLTHHPLPEE